MSPKAIGALAVAALVCVLAAALVIRGDSNNESPTAAPASAAAGTPVFPNLRNTVGDVATIEVKTPSETFALRREDGIWRVPNPDGYWADQDSVAELLGSIAMLDVHERKTSNPDLYDRLGVEPVGEGASSLQVTFEDESGGVLADLIIGQTARNTGRDRRTYVRQPDAETALLVNGSVTVARTVNQWIDSLLMDIDPARVSSVEVDPWNEDPFTIARDGETETGQPAWTIVGMPDGKQVANDRDLQNVGRGFQGLRQASVRALADAPDTLTSATLARAVTNDGVVIEAEYRHNPDNSTYWSTFAVSFDENARGEGEDLKPVDEAREEAEMLARKVDGWIFQAPNWKATAFYKTLDELLQDAPEPPPPPIVAEPEPIAPTGS